ncbi:glycosyltransferase family 4 protein [Candidatus Curtissbacteria bacterium]|nr:glycosyltransferase family 4 protein [Candidatus Curtissbacteria bacterium]
MAKDKVKISIVRGAFLNPFELQNYYPLVGKYNIRAVSSLHPISEDIKIPLTKLSSPTDLPDFPFKMPILNRLFIDAHYLFGLEKAIAGSDIVHVAETYYHYTIQAIKAKQKGLVKKVVSTVWEVIPFNNEGIRGRKEFKKLAYEYVDHFLAVTNLARKALLEEGVNDGKISVIPMGVDLARFRPAHRESREINIICISRLVEEKGVGELVKAFLRLREKNNNLKLTLVGDGPLKNNFLNIPGVEIKKVPYGRIHLEYQNADIFCLPSKTTKYWQEQYGMALVEAIACGLPIITTKTGAIGEVCADAAIYSKQGDVNDLKSKLERLIGNKETRLALSKKAGKRALAVFDHRETAKKLDTLYQKVLWE